MLTAQDCFNQIQEELNKIPINEFLLSPEEMHQLRSQKMEQVIHAKLLDVDPSIKTRVLNEFNSWGPLCEIMADESVTEILVNGPFSIWYEKEGKLLPLSDRFFTDLSFRNCLERLCVQAKAHITKESPCVDSHLLGFRISLIGSDLTGNQPHFSLRRHPKNPWTFAKLQENGWCEKSDVELLQNLLEKRKNFLVIGSTGAGKTSVLNSCLQSLPEQERVVVIEDTSEITLPNTASMKLLTREDPQGVLPNVDQTQLVKRTLRMRPDRIVMGEIRGSEAKDFLMSLATGHAGSFGTLHAQDAGQALIRLEMLIQMGAPQWSLSAIRRLIQMSLDYVVVAGKDHSGKRKFRGLYRLSSLEDHGFLIEQVNNVL